MKRRRTDVDKTILSVDDTYRTKVYAGSAINYSLSLMSVKLNNTQNMGVHHGVGDTKDTHAIGRIATRGFEINT